MKILLVLPIPYSPTGGFWFRDLGLVTKELRSQGIDAWLVCLQGNDDALPGEPVITTSLSALESADWWAGQKAEGAILGLWRATRYEKIRQAARTVTPLLIEKADSDGVISPRVWPTEYLNLIHTGMRDSHKYYLRLLAPLAACFRTAVIWMFPALLDRKIASCLSRLPILAVESPIAVERLKRFVRTFRFAGPRVVCISHPIDLTELDEGKAPLRVNRIVSAGRWNSYQKKFPLLIKVIVKFLELNPTWDAVVVGQPPQNLESELKDIPQQVLSRLKIAGSLPHHSIGSIFKSSKIFLISSRHESFNIAAAEALCCGCSVVGPIDIASVSWFTSEASGTAACRNSTYHLLDALSAESVEWCSGKRDAVKIADTWRAKVGSKVVAHQLMDVLLSIEKSPDWGNNIPGTET